MRTSFRLLFIGDAGEKAELITQALGAAGCPISVAKAPTAHEARVIVEKGECDVVVMGGDSRPRDFEENRFRALIARSSEAIALIDPTGTVLYASPSTET